MTDRAPAEYRAMISGDIEDYSSRTDPQQAALQEGLIGCLGAAARDAGLDRLQWRRQPSGDGEFSVLPADADILRLTDKFIREMDVALSVYNKRREAFDWTRLRLRLALHAGPIPPEGVAGVPGRHAVQIGRLLDSPPLRTALTACPGTDLAVIVSDRLFDDYVAQGSGTLRPAEFRQVTAAVKKQKYQAYVLVPGYDVHGISELDPYAVRPGDTVDGDDPAGERPSRSGGEGGGNHSTTSIKGNRNKVTTAGGHINPRYRGGGR